jgi:hypothetical protein
MHAFLRRWLREPVLHFFLAGILLFAVDHWRGGDPRTIVASVGVRQDLARRFEDSHGRPPSPSELRAELEGWTKEEALYREALRAGLDRDDANVRRVLVSKMYSLAESEVALREPTQEELDEWFLREKGRYEKPRRYDFEFLSFSRGDPQEDLLLARFEESLAKGENVHSLGRPTTGGNLTVDVLKKRLAPKLARKIVDLDPGKWTRIDGDDESWLVLLKNVSGGLPEQAAIRSTLVSDWKLAQRKEGVDRILQETVNRYDVEWER